MDNVKSKRNEFNMDKILQICINNRLLIILSMVGIIGYGIYHYQKLPTDAFPDVSPIMVPIFAEAHGMAPEEVERSITYPIESAMNGLPGVRQVKSTSAFGMSVIYVYFKDNVNIYFARQIVSERLANADLPVMEERPGLGPISTGLGEVFMYYLTADSSTDTEGKDPDTYLREVNDWSVKRQLQAVPGVTEILSMGGHVLQYDVRVNPNSLDKYKLVLDDVVAAITSNNRNAGGQFLVLGSEEYLVRGVGLIDKLDDLKNIHLKSTSGIPVRLSDVADVNYGKEIRRGVVTRNGTEEVVAGIVMKLYGQNTSEVIKKLDAKIPDVQKSLPEGVKLVPYYSQNTLVENATHTVKKALLEGGILVVAILLLFLGNIRSAFIVALSLPVCAFIAVICMGLSGMSANLMSLGGIAIAIGMLSDASIVMVENIFRHLSETRNKTRSTIDIIFQAGKEVARPIIFSVGIIIIVFLPLFTLEGVEGKMFAPMAFTITFALLGSLVAALVLSPVLSSYILKHEKEKEATIVRLLKSVYSPILQWTLKNKIVVIISTMAAFVGSLALIPRLGTEFIPALEEGVIQINVAMAPSISLEKATETIMKLERRIKQFDEVDMTLAKIGRPEAGSHPHPVNSAHIQLMLKPEKEWKKHKNKKELVESINKALIHYPGVQLNFSQPIQNMFDELLSGVKTQLAIKVYGDDLNIIKSKSEEIKEYITSVKGLVDLASEQSFGQPQVQILADRNACARYGVNVSDILEVVELAIGGETIDQVFVNNRRFGIQVRFDEQHRSSTEVLGNILVHTENGLLVPLSQVAQIESVIGPIQINRENNQRRWVVSANVRGRDMGSVVADIKEIINKKLKLPPGYYIEYGGQFENQQRAMKKLLILVPVALVLIFLMLFISLGTLRSAALIFLNVPLALIGGILGLFLTKEYLSVPASVGFIALFGIAMQNGLVLVSYINLLREKGMCMNDAIFEACTLRLRPVLMTALTTVLGIAPLLFSQGIGSEVQRPLAVVVVYGLLSSTFLTLLLIPSLYAWFAPKLTIDKLQ
jgi:cobalt-zinc-cadmium resistance protein CzcA